MGSFVIPCPRRMRGHCDGTRHLAVCPCGAAGPGTCHGKTVREEELPRCCTETETQRDDREEDVF